MKTLLLAGAALLALAGPVRAEGGFIPPAPVPIPDHDPLAQCQRYYTGSPVWVMRQCMEREQSGYDFVKLVWPDLSLRGKKFCVEHTPGAYAALASCVDGQMLFDARLDEMRNEAPPSFRR